MPLRSRLHPSFPRRPAPTLHGLLLLSLVLGGLPSGVANARERPRWNDGDFFGRTYGARPPR